MKWAPQLQCCFDFHIWSMKAKHSGCCPFFCWRDPSGGSENPAALSTERGLSGWRITIFLHLYIYIIRIYAYIYIYKLQMNMTFGIFLLLCWITRRKGKVKLVGHSMGFLRRKVAYTTELNRSRDDAPPLWKWMLKHQSWNLLMMGPAKHTWGYSLSQLGTYQ